VEVQQQIAPTLRFGAAQMAQRIDRQAVVI